MRDQMLRKSHGAPSIESLVNTQPFCSWRQCKTRWNALNQKPFSLSSSEESIAVIAAFKAGRSSCEARQATSISVLWY